MIGTDELFGVAVRGLTELRAAMGAVILDHTDLAVEIAHQDDRTLADPAAPEIAGIGNFGSEPDIAPMIAVKEAAHLLGMERRIRIDPVRHAAWSGTRPIRAYRESLGGIHLCPPG